MRKRWFIALMLLPALIAEGQMIRLTKYNAPNALYVSLEHLFDYDLYQRTRIGLNAVWVSPNENAAHPHKVFGQWTLSGYGAYSFGDHDWKYGFNTQLRLPGRSDVRVRLGVYKDLERAANRNLSEYTILTPSDNLGIMASRFIGVKGGKISMAFSPQYGTDITIGLRETWEDYRFDSTAMIYPTLDAGQQTSVNRYTELFGTVEWNGLTLDARGGEMHDSSSHPYLRAILQYKAHPGDMGLNVFGQIGFATNGTPYSRMFDLSGTAFSRYFFNNSFLTVRPNTFTANLYAHLCLNYTAPKPLWTLSWSRPKAFLQINAMWGRLFGQNEQGRLTWDGLPLQAPYKGLLEPAAGLDGLVRWGLLDIGCGVAYQICPHTAPYVNTAPSDNFTFAIVATFILDRYK